MPKNIETDRRNFLKSMALASAATVPQAEADHASSVVKTAESSVEYPRSFTGPALAMLSFPLGGIGAGSVGLGGRGQLRDWEIFNCADKGNSLLYAFPSIWVKPQGGAAVAHVLESRIETPYEGQDGLGSRNAPGLSRLQGATFTGEFPKARIDFHDNRLPVQITLEAGTPFIPLDGDASGLPLASLRYRVRNNGRVPAEVSIAYSIENPVKSLRHTDTSHGLPDKRTNQFRSAGELNGLFMSNPALEETDEGNGSFALAVLEKEPSQISHLPGWPAGKWWNSALLFWDDFSTDGALGPAAANLSAVGALAIRKRIQPGEEASYSFLLAWHFPNRTPQRCGWTAPKGQEKTVIGNWYATKFGDAWAVAKFAAANLPELQRRTDGFVHAVRETTVPNVIKEAAMSNLSTLVSTTSFRTADGEFHGFEGADDHLGCCFGNCTHVWNYETATAHLFPSFSQSLRRSAFGYSMDERGAMYFRQLLPDGYERSGFAAADGQMGQIIKVYMDWQLSGDRKFLEEFWPKAKRALEFAWIEGGWDANRDGVLEGVQHNTYDVEFYGPNPLCTIYYLGALRASEEMARALQDQASTTEYRRLFESGRHWLDANLFNGEYYIQRIEGRPENSIAKGLRGNAGADDPEHPQFQVGKGCLIDQLLGQYLAEVCGLGTLIDSQHLEKALNSIYRHNHKAHLYDHDTVQRTFALNDEAALVICDYPGGERPKIPFPYYAEVMTGFEHAAAALMLYRGRIGQGVDCINDIRERYDGIRRNPWDEAECGHHYARAMASWSSLLALSGFQYRGSERRLTITPRVQRPIVQSFWSAGQGWGSFTLASENELSLRVSEGSILLRRVELAAHGRNNSVVRLGDRTLQHTIESRAGLISCVLAQELNLASGQELKLSV